MALTDKLAAIGDAIRSKTDTKDLIPLDKMPSMILDIQTGGGTVIDAKLGEITIKENGKYPASDNGYDGYSWVYVEVPTSGGTLPPEAYVISGDCASLFSNDRWKWYIDMLGSQIRTENLSNPQQMFSSYTGSTIPFALNFADGAHQYADNMFNYAYNLTELPAMNNFCPSSMNGFLQGATSLVEFPESIYKDWNWTAYENNVDEWTCSMAYLFYQCYKLRKAPISLLAHASGWTTPHYAIYNSTFAYCHALDEVVGIAVPYTNIDWYENAFNQMFAQACRLKKFTFAMQDNGLPYTVRWANQEIDLTQSVGYFDRNSVGTNPKDCGLDYANEVTDSSTYDALKDTEDWYTRNIKYSRFNIDSAIALINSLPDTSAFAAEQGGITNTIKFRSQQGMLTDSTQRYSHIGMLGEPDCESIVATATARGWKIILVGENGAETEVN